MKSKSLNRIGFISSNALRQILVSAIGMVIPFMVILNSSKEIWGEFVSLLLYSLAATQIINWGNKEYLLRKFSETPSKINDNFSSVFLTRLPLVLLLSLIGFFFNGIEFGFYLSIWILGRFLIHSYEVLVVYEKRFNSALALEIICFIAFAGAFYLFQSDFNLRLFLILYSFYQLIRGIGYLLFFKATLSLKTTFNLNYYTVSIWFFLLSVLGFLASKIDVYIIEHFDNKILTSDYQIINSLLVFIMSICTFIYAPFTKNIYRNNEVVIKKTKNKLAQFGLIIVPVSLCFMYGILHYFLNLELPFWFYIIAFFYVFPSYIYGIEIVNLFKQHREKKVVVLLLIGTVCNFMLTVAFLNFNFGITSALLGSAVAQIVVLILFKLKTPMS